MKFTNRPTPRELVNAMFELFDMRANDLITSAECLRVMDEYRALMATLEQREEQG